jgi:hypothetical protein
MMDQRQRAELLDKAIESIRTNPFGEFSARTKWMPKERTESLLADIRRRLDAALAQDEADIAAELHAAELKQEQKLSLPKQEVAQNHQQPVPLPRHSVAHQKRERSPVAVIKESIEASSSQLLVKEERVDMEQPMGAATTFKSAIQAAKAKAAQRSAAAAAASSSTTTGSSNNNAMAEPSTTDAVRVAVAEPAESVVLRFQPAQGVSGASATDVPPVRRDDDEDDDESFDVFIPDAVRSALVSTSGLHSSSSTNRSSEVNWLAGDVASQAASTSGGGGKHASQLTKDEYMQQFKRAPRRGEIGVTAEQVAEATSLGYVMSGSRNRASDKYVDRIQRQLHEKQASQLRLDFLKESDRRSEAATMDFLKGLLETRE